MVRVIHSLDELESVLQRSARRGVHHVRLEVPLGADERARLEKAINRSLTSCGCGTGAAFVFVGLAAIAGLLIARPDWMQSWQAQGMWRILLVVPIFALLGKLVGLVSAERRFRLAIRQALASSR